MATASYNANNQQLAFGGATMTFDQNGNLATQTDGSGTTTYTRNARDQLTALNRPGLTATFGYDGLGRRRTKTINGAQTNFLYDGLNPVQEGILPATPSANLLTGFGIDEYLTRTDAEGARHFLPDALGSTLALSDALGAVGTEYTYEPFGGATASGPSSASAYQYTGRENDGTGLYYYRARYYHPAHHRFLSEDPLGFVTGDVNVYAYVSNAPTMYADPYGLWRFIIPRVPPPPAGYPRPPGWTPEWPWRYPEYPTTTPKNPTPRWFDPKGGEWRWHPPDKWHPETPKGHWDHNPWTQWNSPWGRVPPAGGAAGGVLGGRKDPWEPCFRARACI